MRSTRRSVAPPSRRCDRKRKHRAAIAISARSAMRRAGCSIMARVTTRHGSAAGSVPIRRHRRRPEPLCLREQFAGPAARSRWQATALNSNFQNGWTYKSSPGVIFFQYEPGRSPTATTTSKPSSRSTTRRCRSFSITASRSWISSTRRSTRCPRCCSIPIPAKCHPPARAGTRRGRARFYRNPRALDYAMGGYTKEADIWEAGHAALAVTSSS